MAESTNKPTRFEPQTAAASQRMADSVFDRLSAGNAARGLSANRSVGRTGRSRGDDAADGARLNRPLRARDVIATAQRACQPQPRPRFPTVVAGWGTTEVMQGGLRAREAAEAGVRCGPCAAAQLEPIVAAVESVISRGSTFEDAERPQKGAPMMPVLRPPAARRRAGTLNEDGSPRITRSTIDASLRMLDALRATLRCATAGDQRISLGDMTRLPLPKRSSNGGCDAPTRRRRRKNRIVHLDTCLIRRCLATRIVSCLEFAKSRKEIHEEGFGSRERCRCGMAVNNNCPAAELDLNN